jgi:alpha-mannosidase
LQHIAQPGSDINQILGQLEFSLKLSEANADKFDSEINKALEVLEVCLDKQGTLTRDACAESEKQLLPLKEASKEYVVICASHAHIDMNWMWGWQETVAATLATFRTVLSLMKEYPEFTFSQSQSSVYHIVEKYDPEMKEEIQQRIKEGRWEVTASAWVETDKNMPCTESLLRHIRYTKDYLSGHWGVNPESLNIDFSPDSFGHSANIPEIDAYGGIKYFYHCRGFEKRQVLYRWLSPSGNEVLGYCEPFWYNSGITPHIAFGVTELASLCGGLKTSLIVYGVGDHGGGPTRKDIEKIIEMKEWPVFPAVKFGTFHEYFKTAETVREKLPVIDREINFFSTGCYTTQSRIKLGNRHGEAALLDAEALDTYSRLLTGKGYSKEKYVNSWQDLLFTHFHDILTGSCVRDTREHAMGLYANVMALTQTMMEKAALNIAEQIDTSSIQFVDAEGTQSEGAGVGFGIGNYSGVPNPERGRGSTRIYHVFNPLPDTRFETVEFTAWDWTYDLRRVELIDASGNSLPFQLLDKEPQKYWDHYYFRFISLVEVPASGYTTVVLKEAEMGKQYPFYYNPFPRSEQVHEFVILENDHLRAKFDSETGALCSLINKKSGTEQVMAGGKASLILNWAAKSTNSAWTIGRYLSHEPVTKTTILKPSTGNPLRNTLEIEQEILNSKIKTRIALDKDSRSLAYSFEIVWNEIAASYDNVPVLCFSMPLNTKPETFQYDVPGGFQRRPGGFQDKPGLQYGAAVNGENALAFITDCKYGYRGNENTLSVTLINTASSPDPYPERGEHVIHLWISLTASDPKALSKIATAHCHPVNIVSGGKHAGKLPLKKEVFKYDTSSAVLSSVAMLDEKTLLVRGYEIKGRKDKVSLALPGEIAKAQLVDLDGKPVSGDIAVNGSSVAFDAAPYKIFGVLVNLR